VTITIGLRLGFGWGKRARDPNPPHGQGTRCGWHHITITCLEPVRLMYYTFVRDSHSPAIHRRNIPSSRTKHPRTSYVRTMQGVRYRRCREEGQCPLRQRFQESSSTLKARFSRSRGGPYAVALVAKLRPPDHIICTLLCFRPFHLPIQNRKCCERRMVLHFDTMMMV